MSLFIGFVPCFVGLVVKTKENFWSHVAEYPTHHLQLPPNTEREFVESIRNGKYSSLLRSPLRHHTWTEFSFYIPFSKSKRRYSKRDDFRFYGKSNRSNYRAISVFDRCVFFFFFFQFFLFIFSFVFVFSLSLSELL